LAHETWFTDDTFAADWGFVTQTPTLLLLLAAVALMVVVRLIARVFPGVDVPALGRLAPYMPFAMRLHVAVSLVGLLSSGWFLAPSMDLPVTVPGVLLGVMMAMVAISMATGWHARLGAALLLVVGPLGAIEFGWLAILSRVDLLGVALFVLLAGPGRWSADVETGREREMSPVGAAQAVWALRVSVGLALIVVAFAEKLAVPSMATDFLASNPDFNVAQLVGIGMSDLEFARVAGGIEVLFGLLLISGALSQAAVLIAGVPFNLTLWFFGTEELLGHLPVYGAMLVLLVFASDPALRPAVSAWLPPLDRPEWLPLLGRRPAPEPAGA
jgi:hypothetical protein